MCRPASAGTLIIVSLLGASCSTEPPERVLDAVVNLSITSQRPDQHLRWMNCDEEAGFTHPICNGERSGLLVIYPLGPPGSPSTQIVTGGAITAASVDSYAHGRFGPSAGSCTVNSAGTTTHVTWWNLGGGGIFESAHNDGVPGAIITVSRTGNRAFPCR